jgi:hypothetical protein
MFIGALQAIPGVPYSTPGAGPQSWGDIIMGSVALALAVGGSMLWVRWREKRQR